MLDDIALRNTGSSASSVDSGNWISYLNDFWSDTPYNMDFSSQGTSNTGKISTFTDASKIASGDFRGSGKEDVVGSLGGDKYDPTGYDQAEWEFLKQSELLAEQRAFNSAEAQKNREWQERMSNTAYQRAVEDLEKAGLNKWLAVTGGNGASASTPSGSSATSSAGDVSAPNAAIFKAILQMFSSMYSSSMKILDLL